MDKSLSRRLRKERYSGAHPGSVARSSDTSTRHILFTRESFGFVRGDDGREYYFKTPSFQGLQAPLIPDLRVVFHVQKYPKAAEKDIAVPVEEVES
jgi:hypothetical protein